MCRLPRCTGLCPPTSFVSILLPSPSFPTLSTRMFRGQFSRPFPDSKIYRRQWRDLVPTSGCPRPLVLDVLSPESQSTRFTPDSCRNSSPPVSHPRGRPSVGHAPSCYTPTKFTCTNQIPLFLFGRNDAKPGNIN